MQKPMGIAKTLAMAGLLLAGVAMAADPEKPLQSSVGAQMADLGPQYLQPLARETFEFTEPIGEVQVRVSFRMLPRRGAEAADRGESGLSLRVENLPWCTARIESNLAPPSIELVELERIR